jgi:cation diffusion facilitator CzcD-associated flavoprotein CzcO
LETREPLKDKSVAVLGYGKSATDAALESAAVAKETHIVLREPHWPLPAKLAGILPVKWGLFNRLTSALIPLYQDPTPVERVMHTLGRPLAWFYWRLVELLIRVQFRLGSNFGRRVSLVPAKPIEIDSFGESTMLPRPDFYRLLRKGTIAGHRTTVAGYRPNGLVLGDGSELDVDVMVLATGWKTDFSFIAPDIWQQLEPSEDGFYLYRHILHPKVPGLYFIGRASTISSILTYSLQARWLGAILAGRLSLPPEAEVTRNIEAMRVWKRALFPFSSARSARLIAHTQHYHDELLRDFGTSPWRKKGAFAPFKEVIAPYEPGDYAEVVAIAEAGAIQS